ncbi:MAG TPA: 2-hydroxyglutaryl-CoA dehydratase, partial [Dehalococcoidia bacterium]
MNYFIGIDIGSAYSKGVLLKDSEIANYHVIPSGANYRAAADAIKQHLLKQAGLTLKNITGIVATGTGAGSVDFA